jgi:hypothetical protein
MEDTLSTDIFYSEEKIHVMRNQNDSVLEEIYYRRRTLLKRIADGLAWEILNYDSHAISACAIGHSAGFIFGKESYQMEREYVKEAYLDSSTRFAIQCDITNILHLADVLIVKEDGQILFEEIKGKTSKNNRRAIRQKNRHKEIISFLNYGQKEPVIVCNQPLRAMKSNLMFKHYWNELDSLAFKALKDGFSWKLLDDCVILSVNRTQLPGLDKKYYRVCKNIGWDNPYIIISSLGRHLQKNISLLPITCLPITIFPIQIDHGIDFMLGKLNSTILVNASGIVTKLIESGLNAHIQPDKRIIIEMKDTSFSPDKGAWAKILNELITVPSFIEYIIASAQLIENEYKPK